MGVGRPSRARARACSGAFWVVVVARRGSRGWSLHMANPRKEGLRLIYRDHPVDFLCVDAGNNMCSGFSLCQGRERICPGTNPITPPGSHEDGNASKRVESDFTKRRGVVVTTSRSRRVDAAESSRRRRGVTATRAEVNNSRQQLLNRMPSIRKVRRMLPQAFPRILCDVNIRGVKTTHTSSNQSI